MSLRRGIGGLWEEIKSFQTEETERTKPPNVKQHDGSSEEGSHKSYYHISSSPPSKHMVGLHFLASLVLGLTV